MTSFLEIDKSIFTWINTGWSNPVFDAIMPWISCMAEAKIVWLWIAFIGILKGWRMARASGAGGNVSRQRFLAIKAGLLFGLYVALIYGVTAGACSSLKQLTDRSRPFMDRSVMLRVIPSEAANLQNNGSFPSGHATNAFMLAAILAGQLRRKRFAFYTLAALIALSRVYLGVHFPADVVVGACLGLTITWFMISFRPLRRIIMREHIISEE